MTQVAQSEGKRAGLSGGSHTPCRASEGNNNKRSTEICPGFNNDLVKIYFLCWVESEFPISLPLRASQWLR